MFCQKCGTNNPDSNKFCVKCGASLKMGGPTGGFSASPAGSYGYSDNYHYAARRDSEGVQILRQMGSSPMFLTAVIAFTAATALGIIASATASSAAPNSLLRLISMLNTDGSLNELEMMLYQSQGIAGGAGFIFALVASVPAILTTVALWLIYTNAKKESGTAFSTTGFTIIRVLSAISFAALILGTVILLLFMFLGTAAVSRLTDGEGAGIGVIVFLISALFATLPIIYYWKLMGMLGTSGRMAAGGPVEQNASVYVGVYVMLQTFGSLWGLVSAPGVGKLQAIASGTASVTFSLLIFAFREKCAAHRESSSDDRIPMHEEAVPGYSVNNNAEPVSGEPVWNPSEWTGYEPERVNPDYSSEQIPVPVSNDAPESLQTIVEPAAESIFGVDYEDTIMEPWPGEVNEAVYPDQQSLFENPVRNETRMTYPEDDSARQMHRENDMFAAADDLQNQADDPFANRERPIFSESAARENSQSAFMYADALGTAAGLSVSSEEKAEQERQARERAEQERQAHEKAEQERLARERAEQERQARERAEQERQARERAEQERQAREKAEQERLARERAEQERQERERAEQERQAGERAEQERRAKEALSMQENIRPVYSGIAPIYQTTPLNTSMLNQPSAILLRHRNQEQIAITFPHLRIGRNSLETDYTVKGNPAIGRHHADIIYRSGSFYIIDNNSTNHVYINGTRISPGEEVRLPDRAVIRLADEDFTFQVAGS